MNEKVLKKPELLAPAGSPEALDAAIAAGADAVYFGASAFNARINAVNFDRENIKRAVTKCKNYGVKSNITFNTLIYDREFESALDEVEFLYECGADALIVADVGLAREIKRRFPEIELHASTQMSVHSTDGARFAAEMGFCRAVIARELDRDMIKYICENSPIETEVFIHGALCVSHSGQCLFSSLVGGRSGNRGECAQPCRLPYSGSYPLSLKDNCLAGDFADLLTLGAASLKIEGRMKSPVYVYGVTSIYRHLIDEKRNATPKELEELAALFSRSGFTNGYYRKCLDTNMNGIRTESDKAQSITEAKYDIKSRKKSVCAFARVVSYEPSRLTLTLDNISVTVEGAVPDSARNAPITEETLAKNLLKFGSTDFKCDKANLKIELDSGLILPLSEINKLRREAVSALEAALSPCREKINIPYKKAVTKNVTDFKSARFLKASQITELAREYFDVIFLPVFEYDSGAANGVVLPPVAFDNELKELERALEEAKKFGAKYALVSNIGQIALAKSHGFVCIGDFRFNVTNSHSALLFEDMGMDGVIPSPELTLAKLRDIGSFSSAHAVIYGRIPLMLLEKCVIKQTSGCENCYAGKAKLQDRMGEIFPVFRESEHRNIVYNSRVTYMADKREELICANVSAGHFIFTDETNNEVDAVIAAYRGHIAPTVNVRRIAKK